MIISRLTADSWLWTAMLADPATGHVCNDRPIRAARWEGAGLNLVGVYELDAEPGTLVVTTRAGMSSQGTGPWGGGHVVHRLGAHGSLAHVPMADAADELDPAGTEARLNRRLALAAGLGAEPRRVRLWEDHGLVDDTMAAWGSYWAVVVRTTARQAWLRAPTLAEMRQMGLPLTRNDTPEARAAAARIRSA
jgi:hypothetical protein